MPEMLPGLPNTPLRNCQALIAAVIWGAICERDLAWIASHRFTFFCTMLGMDNAMALQAKRHILSGAMTPPKLYQNPNWLGEGVDSGVDDRSYSLSLRRA